MSVAYAFGIIHSEPCRALYDWNDIDESSCDCGARDYGLRTGRCSDHEVLLTDEGECYLCKATWDAWINRRKPVMRGA